jgi:MATE family multidrug resistance protein
MIAAYASVPIMGLMSVAVMGHLEDPRYLAGVGLATNFFAFFFFIFAFVRWSTTGLAAQAAGRDAARGYDGTELSAVLLR